MVPNTLAVTTSVDSPARKTALVAFTVLAFGVNVQPRMVRLVTFLTSLGRRALLNEMSVA